MAGKLILCATPIGNLEDMSPRALRTIEGADVLACEDTRRTRGLLSHFGIGAPRLMVYNEATEKRRAKELVEIIAGGRTVVLVSDAGMPGLSDPGFRLVKACAERGLIIESIPGPNAAITALAISGLAPGRFVFEGFLARKGGDRRRRLAELAAEERTIVFYESPHRIQECLDDLAGIFGPRPAALARELTKMHEEVRRGTLEELAEGVREVAPRGEIVLVVQGAMKTESEVAPEELAEQARWLMEEGVPRREALSEVAASAGVRRKEVFDALLAQKKSG
jgi:16S rRNA (cytidine1402-2'-O)-methyltransferase